MDLRKNGKRTTADSESRPHFQVFRYKRGVWGEGGDAPAFAVGMKSTVSEGNKRRCMTGRSGPGGPYLGHPSQQVFQSPLAHLALPAADHEPFHAELLVDDDLWRWACEEEGASGQRSPGRGPR